MTTKLIDVQKLTIDLKNFRTVPQSTEEGAVHAMISVSPDRFNALLESILDTGYLITDNIVVLRSEVDDDVLTVKEGNRRVASLKLIHGLLPVGNFSLPSTTIQRIADLSPAWKRSNRKVPCAIYDARDAQIVDRVVTLAHGKNEKASRDQWTPVARARHNRANNAGSEPALDLLEKYLLDGRNLTIQQKERWAGKYPLTVLREGVGKLAPVFRATNSTQLVASYPTVTHRSELESILMEIGLEQVGFNDFRSGFVALLTRHGLTIPGQSAGQGQNGQQSGANSGAGASSSAGQSTQGGASSNSGSSQAGGASSAATGGGATAATSATSGSGTTTSATGGSGATTPAVATTTAAFVKQTLRRFTPHGNNRAKLVALKNEAVLLNTDRTPITFCYLVRSMFEVSAKAYSMDNPTITVTKADGSDRNLIDVLRDAANHLINQTTDRPKVRSLQSAMAALTNPSGVLSITSMNQLVHSATYQVVPRDVYVAFGNVYPLLEAMN